MLRSLSIIFSGLVVIAAVVAFVPFVKAASPTVNLNGSAWSSNIGWIDFHPAFGGVTYNATSGNLDGYAWSDNIGWVSFKGSDINNCPSSPCQPKVEQDSSFPNDPTKGMVLGWARAISACTDSEWNGNNCKSGLTGNKAGGWDGWISFNCENDNSCSSVPYKTTVNLATGDFSGWAWGSEVTGWLSLTGVGKTAVLLPTVTLTASKSNFSQGDSVTLTWESSRATSCTASSSSGDWSGNKSLTNLSPGETIAGLSFPPSSRTYTLTCVGPGGTAQQTVTLSSLYNFTLNVSPNTTTVSFVSGASASISPVSVSFTPSGGFSGSLALSISSITKDSDGSPLNGYTSKFSPATIGAAQSSTLTITLPGTTPTGAYTAVIQGVGGGLTNTVNLKINGGGITPDIRER